MTTKRIPRRWEYKRINSESWDDLQEALHAHTYNGWEVVNFSEYQINEPRQDWITAWLRRELL